MHKKDYAEKPAEYAARFAVWKANLAFIIKHNAERHDVKLDLNEFADLTAEEFAATRLGLKPDTTRPLKCAQCLAPSTLP